MVGCVWIVRLCYCGFELAGATLSPTRISHCSDQSSNLLSVACEQRELLTCPYEDCTNGKAFCVCVYLSKYLFTAPPNKVRCFLYHDFCHSMCISFTVRCSAQLFSVDVLVGLVTESSYTKPVSTPITSTTLVC